MYSKRYTTYVVGFPIRISTDQRVLASPRGFSQPITSFFASQCQGIHKMPLCAWFALSWLSAQAKLALPAISYQSSVIRKETEIILITHLVTDNWTLITKMISVIVYQQSALSFQYSEINLMSDNWWLTTDSQCSLSVISYQLSVIGFILTLETLSFILKNSSDDWSLSTDHWLVFLFTMLRSSLPVISNR